MEQLQLSCSMLRQPASFVHMSLLRAHVQGMAGLTSGGRDGHACAAHSCAMSMFSTTAHHGRDDCRQLLLAPHSVEARSCTLLVRRMLMLCDCRDAWDACPRLCGLAWAV